MGRLDFLVDDLGLELQKSKVPKSYAGRISNYYTVVEINEGGYSDNSYTIKIGVKATEETIEPIEQVKEEIAKEYRLTIIEGAPNALWVKGNMPMRSKKVRETLQGLITTIIGRLQDLTIESGDYINGDQDDSIALYQVNNTYLFLSDRSQQELSQELDEEVGGAADKRRTIRTGIGGAILGALIGAVVWGVLLYFGFYAWFASVLGTYLAFEFYKKNGGLLTIKGIVAVTSIVLVTLVLANVLTYSFVLYQALAPFGISYGMVLLNFSFLIQDLMLVGPFMLDLILGIGIGLVFAVVYAYRLYNVSKNENIIEKV